MLFQVRMDVSIPRDLPEQERARLLAEEKHRAQDLQRQGVWLHLWRVVGCYSNISIFVRKIPMCSKPAPKVAAG